MYICIFDCSVYTDRYVEVEHDICCDREKKTERLYSDESKVCFFSLSQHIYIYIYICKYIYKE